ncbi:hypothetical protein VZ95_13830 [Elstera litoralis]|nr:hypothetical protein VZ95_13830 [Elstera litoralis]
MFLPLDETRVLAEGSKSRAAAFSASVMRLSGGEEKGRLVPGDGPSSWRSIFLGTTNLTVDEILTAGGEAVDDAHHARAIDIPFPEKTDGMFENLHGFESGALLSNHLKKASAEHYGTLIQAFLQRLVQARADDEAGLREQLERWRQRYIRRASAKFGCDEGRGRLHERFATVYLGARLAIKFGLLPWTWRELRKAILRCERDHFRLRAKRAQKERDGLAALKAYVSQNRIKMTRVEQGKAYDEAELTKALGLLWIEGGDRIVGLGTKRLQVICGGKSAAKRVLKLLHQQGALVSERKGDPLKAQQKQIATKGSAKPARHYYHMIKMDSLK